MFKSITAETIESFKQEFLQDSKKKVYLTAKTLMELAKEETSSIHKQNFLTMFHVAMDVWRQKVEEGGMYSLREEIQAELLFHEVNNM